MLGRNERWLAQLCGLIAAAFLLIAFAYPLWVILARSLSWQGFVAVAQNPYYRQRLWFSVWQALLSTVLTVLLGLPLALLFARYDFRGKRLLRSALSIPFVMPTVVVAIGVLALVGPNGLLGVNLRGTLAVLLFAHVFYNCGVVVRLVSGALSGTRQQLFDAAALLGAGPWRTLWQLSLPLALPATLAAATLVFIFCFTSFGVIVILAPGARLATLEVEIYRLSSRLLQLESAGVLVLVQLGVISLFTLIYTRLQARLSVRLAREQRPLPRPRGLARLALAACSALVGLWVLSPLAALVLQTFWGEGLPSLRNFYYLAQAQPSLQFAGALPALYNSLRIAGLSALLALVVGFCFAYAVVRGGWRWLDQASLLPLATSAVTLGFGYLLAFPRLRASLWGMTLAHALIAFPFVARSLLPALRSLPPSLCWAAESLGAGPWRRLWRVELPLVRGALISAASFAVAVSLGEFGASLTLQPARYATLPIAIFDRLGRPGARNYGSALALATLLMALTGLVMLLLERFGEGEL